MCLQLDKLSLMPIKDFLKKLQWIKMDLNNNLFSDLNFDWLTCIFNKYYYYLKA